VQDGQAQEPELGQAYELEQAHDRPAHDGQAPGLKPNQDITGERLRPNQDITAGYISVFTISRSASAPVVSVVPKREFRAAWVATVLNIDWPSKAGLDSDTQKKEFLSIADTIKANNMNAVIVQVKPAADSFFPSEYSPWSEYLTGTQGKAPSPYYDPLEFMIEAAHQRNIEFHAWVNPFRITQKGVSDMNKLAENHPARAHPEWVVSYGGQLFFNPGVPEARAFIVKSIIEIVTKYDVDAIHMDDYFYPYPVSGESFDDSAQYKKYGAGKTLDEFRRANVDNLVRTLSAQIKRVKPYVKFGISPFGVWRNKSTDPTGSDTKAGIENYDSLYADTRLWIKNGWIDYIMPQIYWDFNEPAAPYENVLKFWVNEIKLNKNVHLYTGNASYKVGTKSASGGWLELGELPAQINRNRREASVMGSAFYNMTSVSDNPLGVMTKIKNEQYRYPALVPHMPWMMSAAQQAASQAVPQMPAVRLAASVKSVRITITDTSPAELTGTGGEVRYYVIYRVDNSRGLSRASVISNPANILDIVAKGGRTRINYTDRKAKIGDNYTYYITSVNRLHGESRPAVSVIATTQQQ